MESFVHECFHADAGSVLSLATIFGEYNRWSGRVMGISLTSFGKLFKQAIRNVTDKVKEKRQAGGMKYVGLR